MGKVSLSKRSTDRRISRKDVTSYNMMNEHYVDSNSDSGLDVGGPDSESHDAMSPDEPLSVFKNPSIIYESAMDKLLLPILQAHRSSCIPSEPPVKKARLSRSNSRPNNRTSSFCNMTPSGTNYADLLLEEANLECPEREIHELPQLQTVLKSILSRAESCNGTQDLTAGQTKSEETSKTPPQSLQSNDGTNGNSRGGGTLGSALSGPGRRLPQGRRQLTLCLNFPSKSKGGQVELRILSQPEEQHRARYLTEGSRGAVKDRIGSGYPTIKLFGYCKPVTLQVFIGTDQGKVQPHLFYQASKVCGKNSAPCTQKKIDGTVVLELSLLPEKDMTLSCDCIGILKERNVDVEQRLLNFGGTRSKKRSTRCRLVFRALIAGEDGSLDILQTASAPIVCTQPPGIPEICRKSLSESPAVGNMELFIIGKNFLKDTEVVFEECSRDNCDDHSLGSSPDYWKKVVLPEKDFLQPNHLICTVPSYHDTNIRHPVRVRLLVQSSGKRSEPQNFTYLPVTHVGCQLPGLAPLASCVTDTTLGLVQQHQQSSQKASDLLPTLIPISLAQPSVQPQEQPQANGSILSITQDLNRQPALGGKQDGGRGGQQMVITALVIPTSSDGAATTHILQDNQHALQTANVNSTSSSSGIENPMKTNHIQVLVMPSSNPAMKVNTSPQPVTNSTTIQDTIIQNLKAELSNNIITMCNSQNPEFSAPKQITFRDMANNNSDLLQTRFQQPTFPLSIADTSFCTVPKTVQSIQDLLLQNNGKSASFGNNSNMNTRIPEAECQNQNSLQNSLQTGLGSSLENISVQSLIQTTTNNNLQEQNIQQPSFIITSENSRGFSQADQKVQDFSNLTQEPALGSVFQLEQSIVKHEPKESEASSSGFEMRVGSMMNPVVSNCLTTPSIVQEESQSMSQNLNTLSNTANFNRAIDSYFQKENNLHNNLSQSTPQNGQFEPISVPNPILSNALAGVNLTESNTNTSIKAFVDGLAQITSASEINFPMPGLNSLAPSIGKTMQTTESHMMSMNNPFPTSVLAANSLDSVAVANATSLLNFQEMTLPKTIATNSNNADSKLNFETTLLSKEASDRSILNSSLVTAESMSNAEATLILEGKLKSTMEKINLANERVALHIQDLNNMSQDSSTTNFQNLNGNAPYKDNRSVTLNFQNALNVTNSLDTSHFQDNSTSASIRDLQTSAMSTGTTNQTLNFSEISERVNLTNENTNQDSLPPQASTAISNQANCVTFTTSNLSLQNAFAVQTGKSIANSQAFETAVCNESIATEQEQYSTQNHSSIVNINGAVDSFNGATTQNALLSSDTSGVQYLQQNLGIVNAVNNGMVSFADATSSLSKNTSTQSMTSTQEDGVTFTVASQNMTSEGSTSKSFVSENLGALQDQVVTFTMTTDTNNNSTNDTNQNREISNVSFSNRSMSIEGGTTIQEALSQLSGNNMQDGIVTFTTQSESIGGTFTTQNMGPTTQNLVVTFTSPNQNLKTDTSQSSSFDQRNLENLSQIASKGSSSSGGGPSMDQMSTMMSLLPDAELLKMINPSTFDKV